MVFLLSFTNTANISVIAAWGPFSTLNPLQSDEYKFAVSLTNNFMSHKKENVRKKHAPLPDYINTTVQNTRGKSQLKRDVMCRKNTKIKCTMCNVRINHDWSLQASFDEYRTLKQD